MSRAAPLVLAGLLAGCSALPAPEAMRDSLSFVARETALGLIRTVNAMGVDPWQSSPQALARWEIACRDLSDIATVWNWAVPEAGDDVSDTCAVILEAAAAAPPAMPGPPLPPPPPAEGGGA